MCMSQAVPISTRRVCCAHNKQHRTIKGRDILTTRSIINALAAVTCDRAA